jgi:hypothetical protein
MIVNEQNLLLMNKFISTWVMRWFLCSSVSPVNLNLYSLFASSFSLQSFCPLLRPAYEMFSIIVSALCYRNKNYKRHSTCMYIYFKYKYNDESICTHSLFFALFAMAMEIWKYQSYSIQFDYGRNLFRFYRKSFSRKNLLFISSREIWWDDDDEMKREKRKWDETPKKRWTNSPSKTINSINNYVLVQLIKSSYQR